MASNLPRPLAPRRRLAPLLTLAGVALASIAVGLAAGAPQAHAVERPGKCKLHRTKTQPAGAEVEAEINLLTQEPVPGTERRQTLFLPKAHYVECEAGVPIYRCRAENGAECDTSGWSASIPRNIRAASILESNTIHYWPCGAGQPKCRRTEENEAVHGKRLRRRGPRSHERLATHNKAFRGKPDSHCGEPVDCATGNLTESQTDLSVGGRGIPLTFTRSYNSQAADGETTPGPLGYGWTGSFLDHLEFGGFLHSLEGAEETITVVQSDGSTATFHGNRFVAGKLRAPPWIAATLEVESDGSFLYTLPDQESFHFNSSGRLLSEADRYGNTDSLTYNEAGHLTAVTDASTKRQLTFTYSGGFIKSVTDPMHHTVEYTYGSEAEAGDLTGITEPGETNKRWQFSYYPSNLIKTETDGRGNTTRNEYNSQNQVILQEDAMGRTTHFEYETVGATEFYEGPTWIANETPEEEELEEIEEAEEVSLRAAFNEYGAEVGPSPEFNTKITTPTGSVTLEHFNSEDELKSLTRGYGSGPETESTEEFIGYNSAEEPGFRVDGNRNATAYNYDAEGNLEKETDALGHTTTWHYDHLHDVISEETPNGHVTTITRNEKTGAAEKVERPAPNEEKQTTKYAYGANGEVITSTVVLGATNERTWTYEYKDPYGDRTAETDPLGDKRTFAYNADSQLISATAPSGNAPKAAPVPSTTTIERDVQGRPLAVIEPPEGFLMKSSLPGSFSSASAVAVDSERHVWVGRLSSGAVEEFSKTGEFIRALPTTFGAPCEGSLAETAGLAVDKQNRLWVTDRKGNRVLRFSAEGKCELEIGAKEGKEGTGNGEFKKPQGIAVANGYVWVLDSCNNRVQKFSEAGTWEGKFSAGTCSKNPWGIAVDSNGHVWISQMLGLEALREYTESGQFVRLVSSPNSGNEYSWGTGLAPSPGGGVYIAYWNGARVERYGPEGEYLQRFGSCCEGPGHFQWATGLAMSADGSLWLSEQRYGRVEHWEAFASKTAYTYDANGNLETVTNPDGHTTKYVYDKDDELEDVIQPNGAEQKTEYDGAGQVKAQIDGNAHKTKYERNALEEVKEVIDPRSRKTVKKYDGAGNLKSVTYPGSSEPNVKYEYDEANRLTKISYPGSSTPTVTYKYDKDGDRTDMTDGTGTTTYAYDVLDRLERAEDKRSEVLTEVVKYGYDLASELTKLTYPNGKEVERGYDKAGRLTSVKDWLGNMTSFTYNEDSAPTSTIFPASTGEEDKYFNDGADRMSEASFRKGSTTLASVAYSRDPEGNVTTTVTSGLPEEGTTEYTYDKNGRLASAGPAGAATSYEYDSANNLIKIGSTAQHFDEADQLAESGATKYEYNERGEHTKTIPASGPSTTYGYDQAEELTSVSRPEGPQIEDTYAYNGEGLRSSQKVSGATTYLSWDAAEGLPLLLTDSTNSYIYGSEGTPVEQVSRVGSEETVHYLHHDQQGSTRMLTGSGGSAEGTFTYGVYGTLTGATGAATTPLGYGGQYTNSDTGLQYLRTRSYEPATGQFTSIDPLAPATREPYSYVGDNPLSYSDPSGATAVAVGLGGLAGGGGAEAGGGAALGGGAAAGGDAAAAGLCAGPQAVACGAAALGCVLVAQCRHVVAELPQTLVNLATAETPAEAENDEGEAAEQERKIQEGSCENLREAQGARAWRRLAEHLPTSIQRLILKGAASQNPGRQAGGLGPSTVLKRLLETLGLYHGG
jgi:RHS repeat-associated protein